jgi:hypothetical protein
MTGMKGEGLPREEKGDLGKDVIFMSLPSKLGPTTCDSREAGPKEAKTSTSIAY